MPARALLLLLLCALATAPGCGGGSGCDQSSLSTTIFYGDPGEGRVGVTARDCDGTTTVVIRPNNNDDRETSIVIHELYHVAGFSEHSEVGCYSGPVTLPTYPRDPCQEEIATMSSSTRTFSLEVADAGLHPRVQEAAAFWNLHVGRVIFTVQP